MIIKIKRKKKKYFNHIDNYKLQYIGERINAQAENPNKLSMAMNRFSSHILQTNYTVLETTKYSQLNWRYKIYTKQKKKMRKSHHHENKLLKKFSTNF